MIGSHLLFLAVTGWVALASPGAATAADRRPGVRLDLPPAAPPRVFGTDDSLVKRILGVYRSDADPRGHVMIGSLGHRTLQVTCGRACDAVGFWDGKQFRGVLRMTRSGEEAVGELRFRVSAKDTIRAEIQMDPGAEAAVETWARVGVFGDDEPSPRRDDRPPGALPEFGEYVYVEELPEAITKVPPRYPDAARERKVDGTVLVQVLVGRDGRIKDTKIVKSIPELDDAAVVAVRQWIFKPAMSKGEPVAVWVAVPIKFSLH